MDTVPSPSKKPRRRLRQRWAGLATRYFLLMTVPVAVVASALVWAAVTVLRPAPPRMIRLLGGPEGSTYQNLALRYQKTVGDFGVEVKILPSKGGLDNLQQLADRNGTADVGLVQGGLTDDIEITRLVSLGSVFAQPLMVYYRSPEPIERLSQLQGKRLAIGPEGSGTRALSLKLLKANGSDGAPTVLLPLSGEEAARALVAGQVDAAFLMGDSATPKVMASLRAAPGVALMNFRQAAGYTRKFRFLSRLTLPEGAIDLGKNQPPATYDLVGPTVELVAREDLHPALSDLLISAARKIHGNPGLFRDAGEFPAPLVRDFPISPDAERYYRSGGQFLYRRLPFWLASLIDRLVVLIVPLLVLLIPLSRVAPPLYRWRVRSRIYRWYGALMTLERDMLKQTSPEEREQMAKRLHAIEESVNALVTPLAFADQLFVLRQHVALVRERLQTLTKTPA
jgi:hypothetical protein